MPENTVIVARPSAWGNPWTVAGAKDAGYGETFIPQFCVNLYREWISGDPDSITRMLDNGEKRVFDLRKRLPDLRGKNLGCWCQLDAPCHADVLLEIANSDNSDGGK